MNDKIVLSVLGALLTIPSGLSHSGQRLVALAGWVAFDFHADTCTAYIMDGADDGLLDRVRRATEFQVKHPFRVRVSFH
jgi:hypothetical protein